MFVYLGDQMRLIMEGQMPKVSSDRQLFFQDVALLLQALIGLAVGEDQVRYCAHLVLYHVHLVLTPTCQGIGHVR